MKIITHEDIKALNISSATCLKWVEEMILNKSTVQLPPKISLVPFEGSFCNVMPVILSPQEFTGGVKVVTRFPNRKPSLDSKLLLMDTKKGDFLAILDANWITAMRTGAVTAHSINMFAKKDFSTIGIIGLGNTARATVLILSEIYKTKKIKIKLLKYKGQEELFKRRFEHIKNFSFEYVDNYIDVIVASDVVLSGATYFDENICPDEYFDEGVTVIPIHTRGFGNCDLFFDKIFADDTGHVKHFKNFNKFKNFSEVSDVLNNRTAGRENNKERILVYNIGIAIHDVNFAKHIYDMVEKEMIHDVDFKEPNEKFWI